MKKLLFIISFSICLSLFTLNLVSQPCLPDGITFSTQEQIDNFHSYYPNCTEIEGDVLIEGYYITNLDSLLYVTLIGGSL